MKIAVINCGFEFLINSSNNRYTALKAPSTIKLCIENGNVLPAFYTVASLLRSNEDPSVCFSLQLSCKMIVKVGHFVLKMIFHTTSIRVGQ